MAHDLATGHPETLTLQGAHLTDLLPDAKAPSRASSAPRRLPGVRARGDKRRIWRGRPVVQFVTLGTLVLIVLVTVTCLLAQQAALREAVNDARNRSVLLQRSVVAPQLPPGLITSSPAAVSAFDNVVRRQVLGGWLVRVKIWDRDGRVLYSDEPRLIGQRFALEPKASALVRGGRPGDVVGGLSDLTEPENRYESGSRRLYEVYAATRSPEGAPLLFEAYYRYADLSQRSNEVLKEFLPISIGGLLLFEIVTIPLVWRLSRKVRHAREERELLLNRAVEASDAERRRIAADLHDGVIQELAGASFALAAAAKGVAEPAVSASLDRVAAGVRQSMRSLRSLLVEIYPPNLHTEGLPAALSDLLAPLPGSGLSTSLDIPDDLLTDMDYGDIDYGSGGAALAPDVAALVFRVAQEAVRNTQRHAAAKQLSVSLARLPGRVVLTVTDDGRGFDAAAPAATGHVGLRLLSDIVADTGGVLEVRSAPGEGTRVRLEVPTA